MAVLSIVNGLNEHQNSFTWPSILYVNLGTSFLAKVTSPIKLQSKTFEVYDLLVVYIV